MNFLKFKIENYSKLWGGIENEESEVYASKTGKYISGWFLNFVFKKHKRF